MREYIYKVIIFAIAVIVIFKFTIGNQISRVTDKIEIFATPDGRKEIVESLKKEIKKANEKENYLDEDERELLRNFIFKLRNELSLNDK